MADELGLPGIPEAAPEDPEDVSWALSTAEAMWARGDHLEGIKWVRRAAEAASEAENDERALQLAKVAADLTGMIARRSAMASVEVVPSAPAPVSPPVSTLGSVRPAVPLPSKLAAQDQSSPPPRVAPAPRPAAARAPAAPKPATRGKRRSRENLDREASAAATLAANMSSTSPSFQGPQSVTNPGTAFQMPNVPPPPSGFSADDTAQVPALSRAAALTPPEAEPSREELTSNDLGSAEYWDASPTQNLTSDELGAISRADSHARTEERSTVVGAAPIRQSNRPAAISVRPPRSEEQPAPNRSSMRPPQSTQHDPAIRTSQAVRVVVWRDSNGVHIAPEGSAKIAALTIDAVLVALDPSADLTAWLSRD